VPHTVVEEQDPMALNPRPRVVLADDHAMLLDAFRRLLEPNCDVVGTTGDGRTLLQLAAETRPDVIVLDISMPLLNGMDACRQLRQSLPAVKLIVLTVHEDPDLAAEALRVGACAYLLKSCASSELFTAIRLALRGQAYITPLLTRGTPLGIFLRQAGKPAAEKLTNRQREVLQLLAEGRTMKEVAALLRLTPRTVAFHKYASMEALGVRTSAELVQYAVEHRLVAPKT
jgi:DNA-binding NarL/FixJ family response regulator